MRSDTTGYVLRIDLDEIQKAIGTAREPCEVVLDVSIGTFVAFGDPLATTHCDDREAAGRVADAVERALGRRRQRNIDDLDPGSESSSSRRSGGPRSRAPSTTRRRLGWWCRSYAT